MICHTCGKELQESVMFCNECGTKVVDTEPLVKNGTQALNMVVSTKTQSNLHIMSAFSAIIGLIFWCVGFYKYLSYDSGEYSDPVNAYVGGDAYNFIINGTYFTAFSVIGGVFILGAFILYSVYCLKK